MRRRPTRSSTSSAITSDSSADIRLFINSNSLSLVGEGIGHGIRDRVRVIDAKRQHRIEIDSAASEDGEELIDDAKARKEGEKGGVELKTCTPLCEDVVSRQVRKIRETVQVRDFERLLISVTGATGQYAEGRRRGVSVARLGDVYREFFGAYYDALREVVDRRKMASVT